MKSLAGILFSIVIIFSIASANAFADVEKFNCSLREGPGPQSFDLVVTNTAVYLNGQRAKLKEYNLYATAVLPDGEFQLQMAYPDGPIIYHTAGTWFKYYCDWAK